MELNRVEIAKFSGFADNLLTKFQRKIPQLLIFNELRDLSVPRTGLEPARLSTLAPETSASTIPPPGLSHQPISAFAEAKLLRLFRFCNTLGVF